MLDVPFTLDELADTCRKAKVNSAMGPDNFSPHFLAQGSRSLFACLLALVNFSWQHGVVPLSWRSANIFALFKGKGALATSPDSYRPISLTSVVVKVVERLIHSRASSVFTPSNFQAGFRPRHSCSDQLHRLNALLHSSHRYADKSYRSVVFIDFQKAFDKVWHEVLLWKLWRVGVRGRCLRWIAAFLTNRRIRIAHRSSFSDWHAITAGAPQGAILSPFLFLVYIDDLPACLPRVPRTLRPRCHIFLLADDVALSGDASGRMGDVQLNHALRAVDGWMDANLMRASHSKTKVLCCHRQRHHNPVVPLLPITLPSIGQLALVPSYCYLGVWYEQRIGQFNTHFEKVLAKARSSASYVSRIMAVRSPSSLVRVVRTLVAQRVAPVFTYAWPHWRPTVQQFEQLDGVMAAPLRRALHLPKHASIASLLLECGVLSARALFLRATMTYARRAARLPAGHVTAGLMANPPALFPLLLDIDDAELALGLDHRVCSADAIRAAVVAHSVDEWRKARVCRRLPDFRSALHATARNTAAPYVLFDPYAHLRARLRLNCSALADSRHRRGFIVSAACLCGHPCESPAHLLHCPFYATAAATFLAHPLVAGRHALLLRDPLHLPCASRAHVLAVGSTFLAHVHATRPGGI